MSEVGFTDHDDEEWDFDDEIMDIGLYDDRQKFIEIMKYSEGMCDPEVFFTLIYMKAVGCVTALLEGEAGVTVDLNVPTIGGELPLHMAASLMSCTMVDLFLRYGARTDIKSKDSKLIKGCLLPLNVSLEMLRNHQYLVDWTPNDSILKLVTLLCLPKMKIALEINRLLAWETLGIGDVFLKYVLEGKLIEMAALMLVAREKVMAGFEGSLDVRQLILEEIVSLNGEEKILTGCGKRSKWVSPLKDKRLVMTSVLELLEVFERGGDCIEAYAQSIQSEMTEQEAVKGFTLLLEENEFNLNGEGIDLSSIDCASETFKLETQVPEKRAAFRWPLPEIGMPVLPQSSSLCTQNNPAIDKRMMPLSLVGKHKDEVAQSALKFFHEGCPLSKVAVRSIQTSTFRRSCDIVKKKTATRKNLPDLLSANTYARLALLLKRGMRL